MVLNRMVVGYPLQYSIHGESPAGPYPFYNCFYRMADTSEDIFSPNSPSSVQSDSDNSVSSTEVSPKSIVSNIKSPAKKSVSETRCCWRDCGLWFESLELLSSHVSRAHASSGPGGLFYCHWQGCTRNNKGFNARYKMLVHVRTHTNEKPHQCCLCDKSFSRAENLKIHSRSHSGEKPYLCPVPGCNKAYSNSSDRFKHTRTHQVDKPYFCKVPGCTKRYTDPSSLRKHVKTYKHFVHPNKTNIDNSNQINENLLNDSNDNSCSCRHNCCLKTCLTKAAELLKLSNLINLNKNDINCVTWNKLLDPLVQQTRSICVTYKEEQMELDVPLDLTVHRKI